jgi:hypothetical protein
VRGVAQPPVVRTQIAVERRTFDDDPETALSVALLVRERISHAGGVNDARVVRLHAHANPGDEHHDAVRE